MLSTLSSLGESLDSLAGARIVELSAPREPSSPAASGAGTRERLDPGARYGRAGAPWASLASQYPSSTLPTFEMSGALLDRLAERADRTEGFEVPGGANAGTHQRALYGLVLASPEELAELVAASPASDVDAMRGWVVDEVARELAGHLLERPWDASRGADAAAVRDWAGWASAHVTAIFGGSATSHPAASQLLADVQALVAALDGSPEAIARATALRDELLAGAAG